MGYEAGRYITTGNGNVIIGHQAGRDITTEANNILIGALIEVSTGTSNQINIGGIFKYNGSNQITLAKGARIGTETSALISFYGATPVIQPATTGTTAGITHGSGTSVKEDSLFTGNTGTTAYTLSDVVKALKNLGLMAP
jgi:hypothetical protein